MYYALTFQYSAYTGDDGATQENTGLDFDPEFVFVIAAGAYKKAKFSLTASSKA